MGRGLNKAGLRARCPVRMNADGALNSNGEHRCTYTGKCVSEVVTHIKKTHGIDEKVRQAEYKTKHIGPKDVWVTEKEGKRLVGLRMAKKPKQHESGPWKVIARKDWEADKLQVEKNQKDPTKEKNATFSNKERRLIPGIEKEQRAIWEYQDEVNDLEFSSAITEAEKKACNDQIDVCIEGVDEAWTAITEHLAKTQKNTEPVTTDSAPTDEADDEEAEDDDAGDEEVEDMPVVCDKCGKHFQGNDAAAYHLSKTGHRNFSEAPEEIAPLTEEGEKAKPDDAATTTNDAAATGDAVTVDPIPVDPALDDATMDDTAMDDAAIDVVDPGDAGTAN